MSKNHNNKRASLEQVNTLVKYGVSEEQARKFSSKEASILIVDFQHNVTEKQMELLEKLGVQRDISKHYSKKLAIQAIDYFMNKISTRQLRFLEVLGMKTCDAEKLTREEATKEIDRRVKLKNSPQKENIEDFLFGLKINLSPKNHNNL